MKKEDLLKNIERAILTEESASAIYYSHLKAIASRFHNKEFAEKFQNITEHLISENKKHKKIFEDMYQLVKGEKKNDF